MGYFSTLQSGGSARQWFRDNVSQNIRGDLRNVYSGTLAQKSAGAAGLLGTRFGLPEFGVSESQGGSSPYNPDG